MRVSPLFFLVWISVLSTQIALADAENHPAILELSASEVPGPRMEEKYPDTEGIDIVTDAPWRVVRKPGGWIPVLIFVPDANLPDKGIRIVAPNRFLGLKFRRITIWSGREVLFEDKENAERKALRDSEVINEDGEKLDPKTKLAGGTNFCPSLPKPCDVPKPGGWHRIIRLPISQLGEQDEVFLKTEIVAEPVYEKSEGTPKRYVFSRTLRVKLAYNGFPSLGPEWRYFDAHMHTIAEWSLDTKLLAPRKAFGGPVQMIKESAMAMGLIDAPDLVKNRVIVTDHNAFFSDDWVIDVGPTKVEKGEPQKGLKEFNNFRSIFGNTFGEEVTLQTPLHEDGYNFGSHLLLMRARHRDGPWHGGKLQLKIFGVNFGQPFGGEDNPNELETVLAAAAMEDESFAYAAHPFAKGNHWNQEGKKQQYLQLFYDRSRAYANVSAGKFVLKGAQYWNEKNDYILDADTLLNEKKKVRNVDFFDLHPFSGEPPTPRPEEEWFTVQPKYPRFDPNPTWDAELQEGLIDWHTRIRSLLRFSFIDRPDEFFPRKVYLIGGSDAHGDFNFTTSLLATALDKYLPDGYSRRSLSTNAFAAVRTYVNTEGKAGETAEERALNALADGNVVVTDGPVLTFSLDAEQRFDSEKFIWHDDIGKAFPAGVASQDVFNEDGRIGGNGRFDGGFTALVPKGARVVLKYKWSNTSEFGPPFGGTPKELHVYRDEPGKEVETDRDDRESRSGHKTVKVLRPYLKVPIERQKGNQDVLLPLGEQTFEVPIALSLGVFSRKTANDSFRCYTNPIWLIPVNVSHVKQQKAAGKIPINGLSIKFSFGMSMAPVNYEVMLMPLNERGDSVGPGVRLVPDESAGSHGWDVNRGDVGNIKNGVYVVINADSDIDPSTSKFSGKFAVILKSPKDVHGNTLNSMATAIDLNH